MTDVAEDLSTVVRVTRDRSGWRVVEMATEAVRAGRRPEDAIKAQFECSESAAYSAIRKARDRGLPIPKLEEERRAQLLVCKSCGHREGLTGAAKLDDHCRREHGRPASIEERTPRLVAPT